MRLIENLASVLIGVLIGYLVNNWLAIGRDRRREFNALIEPIRADLLGMKNHPGNDLRGPWVITFILVREKLFFLKRKGFDRAVENYKESKSDKNRDRDNMGGFSYKDTAKIVHAVNDLLRFLKPR
jgi:hypothetical protein